MKKDSVKTSIAIRIFLEIAIICPSLSGSRTVADPHSYSACGGIGVWGHHAADMGII